MKNALKTRKQKLGANREKETILHQNDFKKKRTPNTSEGKTILLLVLISFLIIATTKQIESKVGVEPMFLKIEL